VRSSWDECESLERVVALGRKRGSVHQQLSVHMDIFIWAEKNCTSHLAILPRGNHQTYLVVWFTRLARANPLLAYKLPQRSNVNTAARSRTYNTNSAQPLDDGSGSNKRDPEAKSSPDEWRMSRVSRTSCQSSTVVFSRRGTMKR